MNKEMKRNERDGRIFRLIDMGYLSVPEAARAFKLSEVQIRRIFAKKREEYAAR